MLLLIILCVTACSSGKTITDYPYSTWIGKDTDIWFEYFGQGYNAGKMMIDGEYVEIAVEFSETDKNRVDVYTIEKTNNPIKGGGGTVQSISMGDRLFWGDASFSGDTVTFKIKEQSEILLAELKSIYFEKLAE